jgi:hypothetical protein
MGQRTVDEIGEQLLDDGVATVVGLGLAQLQGAVLERSYRGRLSSTNRTTNNASGRVRTGPELPPGRRRAAAIAVVIPSGRCGRLLRIQSAGLAEVLQRCERSRSVLAGQ